MNTIAVIGAGAVGSFYGARIARAGYTVKFLMRRDYEAVKRNGLFVHSVDGDFHIRPEVYDRPEKIGPCDMVICALKTTTLDEAERLLQPVVTEQTKIVALMNGLGVEEKLAESFPAEQIFGGLAFVCVNRGEPGHVHHLDYGRVTIGHMLDDVKKAEAAAEPFRQAGIETRVTPSLRKARWEKLLWNIPFNIVSVTAGGITTKQILNDPGLTRLIRALMAEVMAAAQADGAPLEEDLPEKMIQYTLTMGHYRPSTLIDFQSGRPLEVEYILGEPVRRAQSRGLQVPLMQSQYWLASFLDRLNRGLVESPVQAKAEEADSLRGGQRRS